MGKRARIVREALVAALAVLVLGGVPGATMHAIAYDLVAPPVPGDVRDRVGVLDVIVRDGRDGAGGPPLGGARVRALAIVDDRAYLAGERTTDAGGRARLDRLPRGETWVLADAEGRARGSTRVVVASGDEVREVSIDLAAEHTLDVAVSDERGAPVGGAEIEVVSGRDPLPVGGRAGGDGRTHVGRLAAGPWQVTARASGYDEATARGVREGDRASIVLRRLGVIAVHVIGEDGEPVPAAHVAVAGAMLWPARATESDARGDVRIGGLAAGTYALRATKDDRVSSIEVGVWLERGEEKSVELKLAPGRFVGVLVTDGDADDADRVGGARVTLAEGGVSPFPLEATTDAKGRARLGPIAPGSATLGVRADGFVSRGAVAIAEPPPPEMRVVLSRAGVVDGRVVDGRGFPIDGATIEIVGTDPQGAPIVDDPRRSAFQIAHFDAMLSGPAPLVPAGELGVMPGPVPPIPRWPGAASGLQTPGSWNQAPTGAWNPKPEAPPEPWVTRDDGTFRASPASPGRVRAIVHHPQYVEAQSEIVTLAPGGEAHVEVVMHAGGALEGRVLDARERPVDGARVTASAMRGSLERTTRTASDGTFAFASLPDSVSVTAGRDDDDEQPEVRTTIAIPEGGRREVTLHLPEPREPLAVRVVDDRDRPVDAAQLSASSLSPEAPLRTTAFTDSHGEATLKRARGVPLRIEASAPGRAPRVVATEGTEESVRIELAPAETATGEVRASRGRDPIGGAEVTLYTDLGVRRARTDASGAFSLGQLAPGLARVDVRAAGFAPVAAPVAIPDTGGRRAFAMPAIEMAVEGIVEGDVADARGDPVAGARVAKDHVPTYLLVGANPHGTAVTDARGRFVLHELPEGYVVLEAYAPGVGRARSEGVKIVAGRTTIRVHMVLAKDEQGGASEPAASGGVAVTLGETGEPKEVVVVSVVEGSAAERAGIAPGDVIAAVDGAAVSTIEDARARLSGPVADDVVVGVRRGDRALSLRVTREPVRR